MKSLKIIKGQKLQRVTIFNPGQGFIPVVLSKIAAVKQINLVDRDLQALKISKENLVSNGYPPDRISTMHQVGILGKEESDKSQYVIGVLTEKDGPLVHAMLVKQAAQQLTKTGLLIVASRSTPIARVATFVISEKLMTVLNRHKSKGISLIVLKKKA